MRNFVRHYGYVDDTLTLLASDVDVEYYQNRFNSVHPQFKWTFEHSPASAHFLDIQFFREHDRICTTTYRKPGFQPQFLNVNSEHPTACKRSIFIAQAHRFLILNSEPELYYRDMQQLGEQLIIRGYPPQLVAMPPLYDAVKRRLCLQKAFSDIVVRRSSEHENSRVFSDSILCLCCHTVQHTRVYALSIA